VTPTQRTLKWLRDSGYQAAVTEHWNPWAKIRLDLFGFADIIAFRSGQPGSVLVQCTSGANHASRRTKILALPIAQEWMQAGNWIMVQSWRRKGRFWVERHEYLTSDMF
jgi:hypothetical protein